MHGGRAICSAQGWLGQVAGFRCLLSVGYVDGEAGSLSPSPGLWHWGLHGLLTGYLPPLLAAGQGRVKERKTFFGGDKGALTVPGPQAPGQMACSQSYYPAVPVPMLRIGPGWVSRWFSELGWHEGSDPPGEERTKPWSLERTYDEDKGWRGMSLSSLGEEKGRQEGRT